MMKILVVDDETDVQTLFEQRFRREIKNGEMHFDFAFSGEQALKYLNEHEQEAVLILSDINMPGMSGLELLGQIKSKYFKPPPVVMMITAYGDAENFNTAKQLGADDFLTKPVDNTDLMAKILVVDDEADLEVLIRQKFRQKIRENLYQFVFAANGVHALEQLTQHHDVDVVLSDINMPEMDGLTLLTKLGEQNGLLKSVIVSAYGDMDNIRTAMNRGAFDFITKPVNFEDLELTMEKTIKHVTQLRETMKAIKENNILRMYVDETVLNFMGGREFESSLAANETVEASIAFFDICGFTSISENETPDKVVRLLISYFDVMVKEIIAQGGYIDKFMGDAVMAVFRGDYHLDRAIDAALAVRTKIANLPVVEELKSYTPKVSTGINSGEMISGNIGSATLRRLDYTVIGDVVNTAQRLQSSATPGQILISESSYQKVKDSFNCKPVGEMHLKNKSQPVNTYEVVD